jgi:cytochrome P450
MDKLYGYAIENIRGDKLRPGSIGALTWEAATRGDITEEQAVALIGAYVTAGLDTTAGTLGSLMFLFAENPDQWSVVRDDPSVVSSAVYEGTRMESVAQWFTRVTTRDAEYDDVVIPEGSRVFHSYAAANRDERHYANPDRFDVRRNPTDTLAFGYGPHSCAGKSLSRMEMNALVGEMARKVDRIEPLGPPVRHLNNLIRSLESFPVRVYPR